MLWDVNTYTAPFALTRSGKLSGIAALRNDPSRIVELNNAYAFAKQNGLPLPPGLVAYRPAANVSGARMIGAYTHSYGSPVGNGQGVYKTPALFIVLSVADSNSADLLASTKDWKTAGGSRWRHITATKTESGVTYLTATEDTRATLTWRDQNSGTVALAQVAAANERTTGSSPFTRLDG